MWAWGAFFPTPAEAAATLTVLQAIRRPSPELNVSLTKEYAGEAKRDGVGKMSEVFNLRVGKLEGLPFTFLWRYMSVGHLFYLLPCDKPVILSHKQTNPTTASAPPPPLTRPQF